MFLFCCCVDAVFVSVFVFVCFCCVVCFVCLFMYCVFKCVLSLLVLLSLRLLFWGCFVVVFVLSAVVILFVTLVCAFVSGVVSRFEFVVCCVFAFCIYVAKFCRSQKTTSFPEDETTSYKRHPHMVVRDHRWTNRRGQ